MSSLTIAWVMTGVIIFWVLSGLITRDKTDSIAPPSGKVTTKMQVPSVQRVRVRSLTAEERVAHLTVKGKTRPARTVTIRAETSGQVTEILVDKGKKVAANQVIARLREEERPAQLAEARTLVYRRELEHEAAKVLAQKAFTSRIRLAETQAELDAARAQLACIQIDLDRIHLRAPFAGVVESRFVEVGDVVLVGSTIATVVDLDPVVITAELTERDTAVITIGTEAEVILINGQRLSGVVSYIATVATATTRTFPIEVSVANALGIIPAGLTAELHLSLPRRYLHAIPPSALTLDEEGRIGIKTVTESSLVDFCPVSIVDSDSKGMLWVNGPNLPSFIYLITIGQEFVKIGQRVEAVPEQDKSSHEQTTLHRDSIG